jgi:hypothetical protein
MDDDDVEDQAAAEAEAVSDEMEIEASGSVGSSVEQPDRASSAALLADLVDSNASIASSAFMADGGDPLLLHAEAGQTQTLPQPALTSAAVNTVSSNIAAVASQAAIVAEDIPKTGCLETAQGSSGAVVYRSPLNGQQL